MSKHLDINSDLGEGGAFDEDLMRYIDSCNIACGGHVGDTQSMRKSIGSALDNKVNIGAHPSYPDKENFGRRSLHLDGKELVDTVNDQLSQFSKILSEMGGRLHHIKFHGALYNDLKTDGRQSKLLVGLLKDNYPKAILFVPPNSAIEKAAKDHLSIWKEGFADRNYHNDLSLVSRDEEDAVITDEAAVVERMQLLREKGLLKTRSGKQVSVDFDTICVHGDTENALQLVKKIARQ